VAIFLALLLGILIGIALSPNPDELDHFAAELRTEWKDVREAKEEELAALRESNTRYESLAREAVSALIVGRLKGQRVAIILNHDFGSDPFPDSLRALLKQAGAEVTSTTTITRDFVMLPAEVRHRVARRLSLYPPAGVHFRTLIAQHIAEGLARGRPDLIRDLHASGLLRSRADSRYGVRPTAVLMVGGLKEPGDAAPERIDLPMIDRLSGLDVRVVGCEAGDAAISSVPVYQAAGIPTVDHADCAAGRLSVILVLAGADGQFGIKETADSYLPEIAPPAAG
jgi:hypothetical protein